MTSEYGDDSAEFELLKKTTDTILGAHFVTKSEYSHPEIIIKSNGVIPHLEEFLKDME
ncbi:MAG: hypothetical protein ACFFF4_08515 [Candidatus Thorarchaeota archaeon]